MNKNYIKLIHQRGLTLVEMMVAITVGLLLLGGVVQIFFSNSQAYRVQDDMARVQENGRFALDMLAQNIRKAGYKANAPDDDLLVFASDTGLAAPYAQFPVAGSVVGGTVAGAPVKANTDAITFRFQQSTDGTLRDCLNQLATTDPVVNVFYVDTQNNLRCRSNFGGDLALIEGVENMLITYGIDTDLDLNADKYLDEANVAASEWDQVVSVRIAVLTRSLADNLTSAPVPYAWNGATITPADRRIRRVFINTVNLRNVTQ